MANWPPALSLWSNFTLINALEWITSHYWHYHLEWQDGSGRSLAHSMNRMHPPVMHFSPASMFCQCIVASAIDQVFCFGCRHISTGTRGDSSGGSRMHVYTGLRTIIRPTERYPPWGGRASQWVGKSSLLLNKIFWMTCKARPFETNTSQAKWTIRLALQSFPYSTQGKKTYFVRKKYFWHREYFCVNIF